MKKVLCLLLIIVFAGNGYSQSGIVKSWTGTLNISGSLLRLVFHITDSSGSKLAAVLDSPDQGVKGIPASSVTLDSGSLKMVFINIGAEFNGKVNDDFASITGEWKQGGNTFALVLTPGDIKAPVVSKFLSIWEGKLNAMGAVIRVNAKLYQDGDSIGILIDSPDQGAKDIPASNVYVSEDSIFFRINAANAEYAGKFNAAKDTCFGTLFQGGLEMPLIMIKSPNTQGLNNIKQHSEQYFYDEQELVFEGREYRVWTI